MEKIIRFSLDDYEIEDDEHSYSCSYEYPVIFIYGRGSATIRFTIELKSTTRFSEINYNVNDYEGSCLSLFDPDDHEGVIDINGTPLHDLILEIMELHDVEYDQELFNGYVMRIHYYIKEIESVLNDGIDRLINLSVNGKSSRNV